MVAARHTRLTVSSVVAADWLLAYQTAPLSESQRASRRARRRNRWFREHRSCKTLLGSLDLRNGRRASHAVINQAALRHVFRLVEISAIDHDWIFQQCTQPGQ